MDNSSLYFLYLHGFQGSPDSPKAQKLKVWLKQQYPHAIIEAPQLPATTKEAFDLIDRLLTRTNARHKVIIGSSLGGYMAHLQKQLRDDVDKVVLINPAVRLDLIAETPAYQHVYEEAMMLVNAMPKTLKDLKNYLVLLQEDDMTTPIQFAKQVFAGANIDIKTGQGHAYSDIEVSFRQISTFLSMTSFGQTNDY
ncbi:YqiA/YcfP family alpha/beta fold hydrolase [Caedibacter taeniospiralis]|uniref:YqiA/YcfP family alpha/beta fold hydrolase n=1 Tax=Caedibacter taeniospiralis TaxID=28907 RepID=UPI000C27A0B2|nr:YqiA/YcfP family alpha/beta fold hydrolase [Caedibacter taeniospiralis]